MVHSTDSRLSLICTDLHLAREGNKKKNTGGRKKVMLQSRYELSGSSLSFLSKATDVATATSIFW